MTWARSRRRAHLLGFVAAVPLAGACAGTDKSDAPIARPTAIAGVVQKGPFVRGTTVTVQELDGNLAPTGRTFDVVTTDDLGGFGIPVNLSSRFVEVMAAGYYYNEIRDELSPGTLTLRSISDVLTDGKVDVNLLTSISAPLIRNLVARGETFADAKSAAQSAVLESLPFASQATTSFDKLDVASDGIENAVLLAASLVIEKYAQSLGSSEVAELTQLLAQIGAAVSNGGTSQAALANLRAARCATIGAIDTASIRANLTAHYAAVGVTVNIPPFEGLINEAASRCADGGIDGGIHDASEDVADRSLDQPDAAPPEDAEAGVDSAGGGCGSGAIAAQTLASGLTPGGPTAIDGSRV